MLINSIILESMGYSKQKAHDLSNQICAKLGYTTKSCYINVTRYGKTFTQYQNLRSVESEAVIRMCEDKIKLEKAVDHIIENNVALYTVLSIVCILLMVLGWNIIVGIKP